MTQIYDSDPNDDLPTLVDRSRVRELPTTARGLRTRAALVAAARRVFERDGFIDSRLTDITKEANCSIGSFYSYFDSKEEVFTAVMQAAQDDMLHPGFPRVDDDPDNPIIAIEASLAAYFKSYERNAKLMLLLEQVTTIDPAFRKLRLARTTAFAGRTAKRIEWLQENGYADKGLDPLMTARALSTIASRLAYVALALEEDWDIDLIVRTIARMWLNALGVPLDGSKRTDQA